MSAMILLDGLLLTNAEDFRMAENCRETDAECSFQLPLEQIDRLKGRHRLTVGIAEQVHRLQVFGYEPKGDQALVHGMLLAHGREVTPPPQS